MSIRRDIYLEKLISKKHNGLIKVITGIRRCGKSFLLFELFYAHLIESGIPENNIVKMAFDSYDNKKYRNPEVLFQYLNENINGNAMHYVLLDEIQMLEDFESILNSLVRKKNVDVYVTGSNARFLSKDIITEFRGRGDEVRMHPLTFAEFTSAYPGSQSEAWQEYVLYGGLPLILSFPNPEQKSDFLKSLFKETYISDIVNRYHIRNQAEFEDLLNIVCSAIGSLTNPSKLSSAFKSIKNKTISQTTIKKYLDYLEDSFLVESAIRYDIKGKKYIATPAKYYFTDLGLRNARLNFRQVEENHAVENIIFNELRTRGFNIDVGVINTSDVDKNGKRIRKSLEIDFVCNKVSKCYHIQSAFALSNEAKMSQEQRPLLMTRDGFKKIIITKDAIAPLYNEQGVLVMNIFDFLLNPNSLDI